MLGLQPVQTSSRSLPVLGARGLRASVLGVRALLQHIVASKPKLFKVAGKTFFNVEGRNPRSDRGRRARSSSALNERVVAECLIENAIK